MLKLLHAQPVLGVELRSDLTGAYIDEQQWILPAPFGSSLAWFPTGYGVATRGKILTRATLVSGWPNTTLTGATIAGATSLPVASVVGFSPAIGSSVDVGSVTIYDGIATETVAVTAVGSTTVTCSACVNAHTSGAAVSALPADVKHVAILATSAFIRDQLAPPTRSS